MGFKADASFLRFLTMGAAGVRRTMEQLRGQGFNPIELERYCGSNKIWATKVKRLRLPDLLCTSTGLRVEVRAKANLQVRVSDAPKNPERVWDAGLRDDDAVAFITTFATDNGPAPADKAVLFTVKSLRRSVRYSKLGPPKSAAEGAERDRTWPAIVPTRDGTVIEVTRNRLIVQTDAVAERPARRQIYALRRKSAYVSPGDRFAAHATILAGAPSALVDLRTYLKKRYLPLMDLRSRNAVDRYAAVKSLRFRDDARARAVRALEHLLGRETDDRVALEAAATATFLGSNLGQEKITGFIWRNSDRPDLRMEAVLILSELGDNNFTRDELNRIAREPAFNDDEVRQAAVWGLGKAGLRRYADLLPFIDDADNNVAMHAITAFATDASRAVVDSLVRELSAGRPRRASAASEVLRTVGSDYVIDVLIEAAKDPRKVTDWILATIGRLAPDVVRQRLQDHPSLRRISPMLLLSEQENWLASRRLAADFTFLQKQHLY